MLTNKTDHFFLPAWRDGRLLFFTNIILDNSTRIEYIAAAKRAPKEKLVTRTGKAPISQEALAECQNIADDGVKLQKFFSAIGSGNLDFFVQIMEKKQAPYPKSSSPLIFTCLYLDFLRKYAVDSEILRMYSNSPVNSRFSVERSVGIYKTLSARLQWKEAETLIDADLDHHKNLKGPSMLIANLLSQCGVVKFDLGNFSDAEALMLRAVKLHDTPDKWRRLGDFANAAQDRTKTIQYYLKANNATPLPLPAALVLARNLVEDAQFEKAQEFVKIAAEMFPKPAAVLQEKIDASQKPAS